MPRYLKALLLLILSTSIASAFLLVRARSDRLDAPNPLTPDPKVQGLAFPPFALKSSTGQTVTNDVFTGRVTIVDFFFTHCPFICPTLTAKMSELAIALKDIPPDKVRFLSISVDPAHDTPARLAEYAKDHNADLARWTFATAGGTGGDTTIIPKIVNEGLKFQLAPDPKNMVNLPDGTQMPNVTHPQFFIMVGPKGEVLDLFAPTIPGELENAAARISAAAAKLSEPRP